MSSPGAPFGPAAAIVLVAGAKRGSEAGLGSAIRADHYGKKPDVKSGVAQRSC
jgi:hypothetical protein